VIDRAVETEAHVKIELVGFGKPPSTAAVEKLSG
jgi:hypothetical protein